MSLRAIVELLRQRIGLEPDALAPGAVAGAVAMRQRALGLPDLRAYATRVAGRPEELQAFAEEVVVAETWFFRGGALFAHLAEHVRACTTGRVRGPPFRALSVPCSSGEEPFSLAIALLEAGVPSSTWTIEGIDLSGRNLARAREGCYGELSFRQTEPGLRRRHFRPVEGGWQIEPPARSAVRFRQGNLLAPDFLSGEPPFDLIFCRNLFIYLHRAARRQALDTLDRLLAPGGLLCLGHADPLDLADRRFQPTGPGGYFLYRRAPTPAPHPPAPSPTRGEGAGGWGGNPPAEDDLLARARGQANAGQLGEALDSCRAHLARSGPSADLYSLLGLIHQARQDQAEAIRCFQKALYLEPEHSDSLLHLMLLYQQAGDHARAALLRRRLRRTKPGGEP